MASWLLARLTAGLGTGTRWRTSSGTDTNNNKSMGDQMAPGAGYGLPGSREHSQPNQSARPLQTSPTGPAEPVCGSKHKTTIKATPKSPADTDLLVVKVVPKETERGRTTFRLYEAETLIPQRRGPRTTSNDEPQKLNQHMPINREDLKEFLHSLGISHVRDLASMVHDEPLTEAQIGAFRTVFEHFAKNSEGCIDAGALSSTLESVGIAMSPEEVHAALESADYDEDGTVGFHDFLSMMTDSQRFSKCVKAEGSDPVDVSEKVFYKTLTMMLNTGAFPSTVTGEIIQYYHKKTLRLIRQAVRMDDDGGHVLTYYSKGAHLLGLNCKQLMKYMKPLEKRRVKESPYLRRPCLKVERSHVCGGLNHTPQLHAGRMKSAKTWRTVEIEARIRELSIKHPGMETKEMITPVKIKVDFSMKERDRLTFDQIEQINFKCRAGLRGYLRTLAQYKRRDSWSSWGSLQSYCRLHLCRHFPQTFSTYSWSWSARQNTIHAGELLHGTGSPARDSQGRALLLPQLPAKSLGDQQCGEMDVNPGAERKEHGTFIRN